MTVRYTCGGCGADLSLPGDAPIKGCDMCERAGKPTAMGGPDVGWRDVIEERRMDADLAWSRQQRRWG